MTQDIDSLDLSDNPTIDSLTRLIGAELMSRLSDDLGGSEISIPHRAGAHSPITVSIGLEAAQKISHVYGGMKFDVPLYPNRHEKILELWRKGMSKNLIAREVRTTRVTVYRVIDKAVKSGQLNLFPK